VRVDALDVGVEEEADFASDDFVVPLDGYGLGCACEDFEGVDAIVIAE
jgi:hypothetical protein